MYILYKIKEFYKAFYKKQQCTWSCILSPNSQKQQFQDAFALLLVFLLILKQHAYIAPYLVFQF